MVSACVYSRDRCILEGSSRVSGLFIRPGLTAAFIRQGRFITGSTLSFLVIGTSGWFTLGVAIVVVDWALFQQTTTL